MPSIQLRYPFPENPGDLESLCLRLYRKHWNVANLQKYGRRGHRQSGGDLLGTDDQGRVCFIQCKHRDFLRSLSAKEVRAEVEAAKQFDPKVDRFAIATTAKRDPELQKLVAGITQEHKGLGLFSVEIDSWDDLNEILNEYSDVADTVYPSFGPGEGTEPSGGRRQASHSPVSGPPTIPSAGALSPDEPADIHSEIDKAGSYMEKGDLGVAEELLDRIQKRQGGRFTPRCWYRVLANRGHIDRLRGEFADAGRLYLQAKDHQPQDPAARWMAGLGLAMTGDTPGAFAAANALVADHPSFARGWALLVSVTSDETALEEIESRVPLAMHDDAEVALNLAGRAAAQEEWAESERHARSAIRGSPNWRDAKVQLAIALIGQGRAEALRSGRRQAAAGARPGIEEARDLLQEAIDDAPGYAPLAHLALLRLNLAAAQQLLGLSEDSRNSVVAAHDMAPEEAEVQRAYAVHLMQQGDLDKAADVLTKAIEGGYAPAIVLVLAQVLAQRNREDDQENAIGLLEIDEARVEQLTKEAPALRSDWVSTLVRLRLARHKATGLDGLLDGTPGTWLRPEEKAIFMAGWSHESGDDETASAQAAQAIEDLTDDTHPLAVRQLALLLRAVGNFEGATKALRRIVPLDHVDEDTDLLFDCADRANRLDLVLEYASELRANGCLNAKYIRNEIALLSQVSPVKAIDVLVELLQTPVDDRLKRECRAVLSCLARIVGKKDLIETRLQELPLVVDLPDARVGRVVVEVLRHGPNPADGMMYAYELYRRFPGELDAHMAVVNSFNMDIGREFGPDEPAAAGPGAAVRYRDDDSGAEHWLIIEDSDRPDVSRDEHALSEPICAAMNGKSRGEQFALRAHPRRTATVLDLTSKYVYRFRQCLGDMETRFSGQSPVLEFHLPKTAEGKPDVSKFIEQLKAIGNQEERILEAYNNNPVPLHAVAAISGTSVFQVAQQVAYDSKIRVGCCLGNREEGERTFVAMKTANAFVIDITAVSTLAMLEAQGACEITEVLRSLPGKGMVSEHVLLDLRRLQDTRFGRDGEQMFVGAAAGQAYHHTLSAAEVAKARESLQKLLDALTECCSVEPGTELARYLRDDHENLLSAFGNAGLHAMLLAAKPGRVLWTDDLAAAHIAAEKFAVNRTWTQAMLLWLESMGRVTKDVQQEATLVLVRAGYVFTGINHEHVLRAVDQERWDVGSPRLTPILGQFAEASVDPPVRLALATATLKAIWQRGLVASHTTAVTFRILDALASDSTGRAIVDAIHTHADQVFGVDVINAEGLKQAITAWKAAEGGIIRP